MLKLIDRQSEMLAEVRQAKHKPKFIPQLLIFFLVFLVINVIIGLVASAATVLVLFSDPEFLESVKQGTVSLSSVDFMSPTLMIVQLILTVVETVVAIIYCRFIEKRSLRSMGFTKKGWLKNYLGGYGIGALMICGAALICVVTGNMTVGVPAQLDLGIIGLAFLGYLVQGMAEEVLVRGYLMNSLTNAFKGKAAVLLAVVISSVIFAAMHLGNPGMTVLSFVNLTLAGVFFALLVLRTDNLWTACAAHSAWNFFQGHVIGSQVSGLPRMSSFLEATAHGSAIINGGSFGLEGGLGVTVVEAIAILLLLFLPERKAKAAVAAEAAAE